MDLVEETSTGHGKSTSSLIIERPCSSATC